MSTTPSDFGRIARTVRRAPQVAVPGGTLKRIGWFVLVNAAVVASLSIISGGLLTELTPIFLLLGVTVPFIHLLLSRWLAVYEYDIELIDPDNPGDDTEKALYQVVEAISRRAGLPSTPSVGIYESPDMNAFATGPTRNRSLIAFSTGLLEQMDAEGIAAVAAHEIAHIANGDMVTMTLVQGVVNGLVFLVSLPLRLLQLLALFWDDIDFAVYYISGAVHWILTTILLFLGSLVVMGFSRWREFAADSLAARLVSREAMISALQQLQEDEELEELPWEPTGYAALKINGRVAWAELLSTHPSLERRIARLQAQATDG